MKQSEFSQKTFGVKGSRTLRTSLPPQDASWFVIFFERNARDALFIRGKQEKLHSN